MDDLEMDLSGAAEADLYGDVEYLEAELSGSSTLRDYDLTIDYLEIDLSGASDAFLTVNESIDVEASGASVLNYKGNAIITRQDLSGGSEIRDRN